jgi:galactitol-specific phosphotransferase system IIC component
MGTVLGVLIFIAILMWILTKIAKWWTEALKPLADKLQARKAKSDTK